MNTSKLMVIAGAALGTAATVLGYRAFRNSRTDKVSTIKRTAEVRRMEPVDRTSEDSFPASDPPAWTGSTTL